MTQNKKELMSKEQFNHITGVLRKKGIPVTPENISNYMLNTSNQRSKFFKPIAADKAEQANIARSKWAAYIASIRYRFQLFGYEFVIYKPGSKKLFDIIKSR